MNDYVPTIKHILALVLAAINIGVYFADYKKGVMLMGIFLLVVSCSLVAIEVELVTHSFFLKIGPIRIDSPSINYPSLFLLLLHFGLNYKIFRYYFKKIKCWFQQLP